MTFMKSMKVREWLKTATRQQMIDFCVNNDPNGCYTDEQNMLEFDEVMSLTDLQSVICGWLEEDPEMEEMEVPS